MLAEFDNTPLPHMTPLFYQHGYEELRMFTRDLLRILGMTRRSEAPVIEGVELDSSKALWTIAAARSACDGGADIRLLPGSSL